MKYQVGSEPSERDEVDAHSAEDAAVRWVQRNWDDGWSDNFDVYVRSDSGRESLFSVTAEMRLDVTANLLKEKSR